MIQFIETLCSRRRTGLAVVPVCFLALLLALPAAAQSGPPPMPGAAAQTGDAPDPPARVGRLSTISGTVSFHTLDEDQWEPAVVNYPVTEGLSFWTEPGARTTLQVGHGVVRLDGSTEVDIQQFNDQAVLLNIPQGSVNFRLRRLDPGETYQVTTPSGTVALTSPGRFHIDAGANGAPGNVAVLDGTAELVGDNSGMTITNRQVAASGPPQDIDTWSDQQESQVAQVPDYVSQDMPGVDDLGGQGNWDRGSDNGPVWYPPVQAGWAPYRYGHWGFVPPWGWTWIDDAPWGFAPFHYGRWAEVGGRWGWMPGERVDRPVYAPALVAFVGGGGLAVSIGVGPVVGWVPLGPREVYVPPYGGSINYIRRVNVTNVTNVNNITVNNINTYNGGGNAARFTNASAATVVRPEAMSRSSHIATAAVKLPPNALNTATVSNQPQVKPSLATVGASKNVVQAVGGNANGPQGPAHPNSPGPKVTAKPLPAAMIKPLTTTTPTTTGGTAAPGPKILTPAAGAGTGTNTNTNTGAGNKGTGGPGAPGPNNKLTPAAGAGTGTGANTNTSTGAGNGNKGTGGPGAPGPKVLTPAAGAGTGTGANTNTNAGTGNKGTGGPGAPGPKGLTPAAGAGTGTGANTNTGAGSGNKGPGSPGAPGPNNRFAPAAGAGTGAGANTNTNTGAGTGNKGTGSTGAPGPNNRVTPAAGAGTGTNTNANTGTGNKATGGPGAPGPKVMTPAPGAGAGTGNSNAGNANNANNAGNRNRTNAGAGGSGGNGQPAGGGQPSGGNKAVQTNVGKPPPSPPPQPPPQPAGNKNANANPNNNAKAKCDPKVQKCPPPP